MNVYLGRKIEDLDAKRDISGTSIMFRAQDPNDRNRLQMFCEHDQQVPLVGRWLDGNNFVIEHAPRPAAAARATAAGGGGGDGSLSESLANVMASAMERERARLLRLDEPELKTVAGEVGVAWDAKASKKTMVAQILAKMVPGAASMAQ